MKNARFVKAFFFAALIILPSSVFTFDFGITANINMGYGNDKTGIDTFDFKADLWPRFSLPIGDKAEFFISAGLAFSTTEHELFVPELLRTDFSVRFGNAGIRLGRMNYTDPLSLIASGLFDGIQFYFNSDIGKLSAGAWYTGFLYKSSANITMTDNDLFVFAKPFAFDDSYLASKRLIAALEWDHPSFKDLLHLNAAVIFQFDLNEVIKEYVKQTGEDANYVKKYNNQYIMIKAGIPLNDFLFEAGGALELSQTETVNDSQFSAAFAGDFNAAWMLPVNINSRLSFIGKIAGGKIKNSSITEFTPITTKYFGNILKHKMSGLSLFGLNYTARINREIAATVTASYFIRNDLGTFTGYPNPGDNDGYFLGPEIFARAIWSPLSDMQINLGGGAFFPSLGDAGPDAKVRWRVELTATLSLF